MDGSKKMRWDFNKCRAGQKPLVLKAENKGALGRTKIKQNNERIIEKSKRRSNRKLKKGVSFILKRKGSKDSEYR